MISRFGIVALAVALLAAPAAAAQSPVDPAVSHVEGKADEATGDPVGFVEDHASEDAVAGEAEWGIAYGCFLVHEAHDDAGTPDPKLEQCDDYEEVVAVPPEEAEEPVAEVENLTEEPVAEVEEIADDAVGLVEEIVDDPEGAPEAILRFLEDVLERVRKLLEGAGEAALGVLGELIGAAAAALRADALLGEKAYAASLALGGTGLDGVRQVVGGAVDGAVSVAHAAGSGLGVAGEAIGQAAEALSEGIESIVERLFGAGGPPNHADAPPLENPTGHPADEDLLGHVGNLARRLAEAA